MKRKKLQCPKCGGKEVLINYIERGTYSFYESKGEFHGIDDREPKWGYDGNYYCPAPCDYNATSLDEFTLWEDVPAECPKCGADESNILVSGTRIPPGVYADFRGSKFLCSQCIHRFDEPKWRE